MRILTYIAGPSSFDRTQRQMVVMEMRLNGRRAANTEATNVKVTARRAPEVGDLVHWLDQANVTCPWKLKVAACDWMGMR